MAPAPSPSAVFVEELAKARERKHLTQQQLADEMARRGVAIDRSTIGKIEAGKRGVSLDDLFAFAVALGVSPMSLLVPQQGGSVGVTPNQAVETEIVTQWLRGFRQLPDADPDPSVVRFFFDAITDSETFAYLRHRNLRTIVDVVGSMIANASADEPRAEVSYLRLLANLAIWTQREWEDLGQTGWAGKPTTPKAKEEAAKELTDVIYNHLRARD